MRRDALVSGSTHWMRTILWRSFLARRFFHLPYHRSRMKAEIRDSTVRYASRRWGANSTDSVSYQLPTGPWQHAEPGSLEFFLLERYLLFAHDGSRNKLVSGRVHHPPYGFQVIERAGFAAEFRPVFQAAGFDPPMSKPALLHYSPGVDVRVFPTVAAG